MRKVVIPKAGGYDQLLIQNTATLPEPKEGEVLVEVHAIGVNYADVCVRLGVYSSAKKYVGWPITPGFEFSGVVIKLGPGIKMGHHGKYQKPIQLKMPVFGVTLFGAYSSHICVPIEQLFPIPKNFNFEEAAGFPAAWLTAYYGLIELGHPRKNDVILVHSAAGGVGSGLVQLGKVLGCIVVGVVGAPHKVAEVVNLGADYVIDKSSEDLWKKAKEYSPKGYAIVLDANGVETLKQSYEHLAPGGKLISYGFHSMLPRAGGKITLWHLPKLIWDWWWTPSFSPITMTNQNKSVMCFNLSYMFDRRDLFIDFMDYLIDLVETGAIRSPKIKCYPLEEVVNAHKDIESGRTVGKLVLTVKHL